MSEAFFSIFFSTVFDKGELQKSCPSPPNLLSGLIGARRRRLGIDYVMQRRNVVVILFDLFFLTTVAHTTVSQQGVTVVVLFCADADSFHSRNAHTVCNAYTYTHTVTRAYCKLQRLLPLTKLRVRKVDCVISATFD